MSTCHRRCPDDECRAAGYPGCAFGTDDDNLSPVARACIANARRALAAANGHTPDRRPYVPPVTPAERVQGTESEESNHA